MLFRKRKGVQNISILDYNVELENWYTAKVGQRKYTAGRASWKWIASGGFFKRGIEKMYSPDR